RLGPVKAADRLLARPVRTGGDGQAASARTCARSPALRCRTPAALATTPAARARRPMPQQERKSLLAPELRELLEEGRSRELQDVLADLHPHDAAEQLAGLSIEEITRIIALLDLDLSKNVFSYLPRSEER